MDKMLTMPKSSRFQLGTSGRTKDTGASGGASGFAHSARYRSGLWHFNYFAASRHGSGPSLAQAPDCGPEFGFGPGFGFDLTSRLLGVRLCVAIPTDAVNVARCWTKAIGVK